MTGHTSKWEPYLRTGPKDLSQNKFPNFTFPITNTFANYEKLNEG